MQRRSKEPRASKLQDARAPASPTFRRSTPPPSPSEVSMACGKANGRRGLRCAVGSLGSTGSAAAEFALVAPMLLLIAAGIADFGMLATRSAALAATTRIGAEYAR